MRIYILIPLLAIAACEPYHPPFNCDRPEATCGVPGAACIGKRCAVPSADCAPRLEYDENAGPDLAGMCVDAPADAGVGEDAGGTDAGPDAAPGVWSRAAPVANVNSSPKADTGPSLSASGLELYIATNRVVRPGNNSDIHVATRADTGLQLGEALPLDAVNTDHNELAPDITGDGLELFFERVGEGILSTKRTSITAEWAAPKPTGLDGRFPSVSFDGLELYMEKSDCDPGCLVRARRETRTAAWGPMEKVTLPVPSYNDVDISADGLALLLNGGGAGEANVLIVRRATLTAAWTAVESITSISFNRNNGESSWGIDQREIFLSSKVATPYDYDILVTVYR